MQFDFISTINLTVCDCFRDRDVPGLDTVVPLESTAAYNMLDVIKGVSSISYSLSLVAHHIIDENSMMADALWRFFFSSINQFLSWKVLTQWNLTLNVRGPSYLGLTRSISWLLMPWFLTSLGHQQPWHWLYRICRSFSYLRKDFKYLCHINVEEWHKM